MVKRLVIVGSLFSVALFLNGVAPSPGSDPAGQGHGAGAVAATAPAAGNGLPFPDDLLRPAGANLPLTFDQAYRLEKAERLSARWLLVFHFSRSPAGKRQLVSALRDPDPQKGRLAAQILKFSADFCVIAPLVEFARKPGRDEESVREAVESVIFLLETAVVEVPSRAMRRRSGETELAYYLRLCDHFATEATEWKHTTYAEYHARHVESLLRRMTPRSTDEDREALFQTCAYFEATDDAERAAPFIIDWADRLARNVGDQEMARRLLISMQLYLGPLDVPKTKEAARLEKALQSIDVWWQQNKQRKPAIWLLDRLAARGYATRNPADVRATAAAIASAIERGSDTERYAAERFLACSLPDGDSLCVPRFSLIGDDPRARNPGEKYLDAIALERALRWYYVDGFAMTWNADAARYEIGVVGQRVLSTEATDD